MQHLPVRVRGQQDGFGRLCLFFQIIEKDAAAGSKEGEKILTYAVMEEPETLDPTLNNYSTSSTFLQNMFCGLFQLEADGSLSNAMCDTYEVSGDGLTTLVSLPLARQHVAHEDECCGRC